MIDDLALRRYDSTRTHRNPIDKYTAAMERAKSTDRPRLVDVFHLVLLVLMPPEAVSEAHGQTDDRVQKELAPPRRQDLHHEKPEQRRQESHALRSCGGQG